MRWRNRHREMVKPPKAKEVIVDAATVGQLSRVTPVGKRNKKSANFADYAWCKSTPAHFEKITRPKSCKQNYILYILRLLLHELLLNANDSNSIPPGEYICRRSAHEPGGGTNGLPENTRALQSAPEKQLRHSVVVPESDYMLS